MVNMDSPILKNSHTYLLECCNWCRSSCVCAQCVCACAC